MDDVQETTAPENPSSPGGSSSSSSAVSEIVLWTHSESSEDSSDGFTESVRSMLDFRSPSFSPSLALKCAEPGMVNIAEDARKYLNLQQYSKAINSPSKSPRKDVAPVRKLTLEQLNQSKKVDTKHDEPIPTTSSSIDYPIPGRRFLPHQLPVYRPRKDHPNVITLMQSMDGPISVLHRVMTEKTRIKIWTRNDKGFRGFLTGFVEAFDKHWNIALRDVDEQFVRKKVIKFPVIGECVSEGVKDIGTAASDQDESFAMSSNRIPNVKNAKSEDSEDKRKEQAISSTFIRLKNYLRQNDGMTRKRMEMRSAANQIVSLQTNNKNKSSRKNNSPSSSKDATKSKTVYVGDMDPLSICRIGLANLSLVDDDAHQQQHQQKMQDSFTSSSATRKSTRLTTTRPDIIQCHRTRHRNNKSTVSGRSYSSSTSVAATATSSTASTCSTTTQRLLQQHTPEIISRTSLKKKSLTVFKTPYEDSFGFMVVAQTRKYELVERHVGQVFLMGNDIVFIETSSGGC